MTLVSISGLQAPEAPVVWSDSSAVSRPDVFELEDGRIIRVAYTGQSAGRTSYSVQVLQCLRWGVTPEQAVEGYCGNMWLTEAGSWELYPTERTCRQWCRNITQGIHKDEQASVRQAACRMVAWSDRLTKHIHDRAEGGDSLICGNWRVALLPEDPMVPRGCAMSRPGKDAVRIDAWRAFLVTRKDGSESFRVVVQRERHPAGGYGLRTTVHAMARSIDGKRPADLTSRRNVPEYVQQFCLSRCVVR